VLGQSRTIFVGAEVVVEASVDYEGAVPEGVFAHPNLSGADQEIIMRRMERNRYQTKVMAEHKGGDFRLMVSATTRRHDHAVKRKWAGGNLTFEVKGS
jgi:hypothetical protein